MKQTKTIKTIWLCGVIVLSMFTLTSHKAQAIDQKIYSEKPYRDPYLNLAFKDVQRTKKKIGNTASGQIEGHKQRCSFMSEGDCSGTIEKLKGSYLVRLRYPKTAVSIDVKVNKGGVRVYLKDLDSDDYLFVTVLPENPVRIFGQLETFGADLYEKTFVVESIDDEAQGITYELK